MSLDRCGGLKVRWSSATGDEDVQRLSAYGVGARVKVWHKQRQDSCDCGRDDVGLVSPALALPPPRSPPSRQQQSSSLLPDSPTHASAHQRKEPRVQYSRMDAMI